MEAPFEDEAGDEAGGPANTTVEAIIGQAFSTKDDCVAALHSAAQSEGFALVIDRSKPSRVLFRCNKGSRYDPSNKEATHESKRRKSSSQASNCRYKVAVKLDPIRG